MRHIETWSVFKVSILFYTALYCVLLVAGVLLWTAATATGLRHNVEKFIADLIASGKFHFVADELFRASAIGGAVLVIMGTATNVLLVVLYNLISEVVGGLTFVVEDRPARRGRPEPTPVVAPAPTLIPEVELKQPRPTSP